MVKEVLESAAHLNIYAQIALVLFLLASILIVVREWLRPKKEVDHLSALPLSDDPTHDRLN